MDEATEGRLMALEFLITGMWAMFLQERPESVRDATIAMARKSAGKWDINPGTGPREATEAQRLAKISDAYVNLRLDEIARLLAGRPPQ